MSDKCYFSLALTTYNRATQLIPYIEKYCEYEYVNEILISDDCSDDYELLKKQNFSSKVKLYKNDINLMAYKNKLKVLSYVKNNWTLLIDSDNFFDINYIDVLHHEQSSVGLDDNIIYCPVAALPRFTYYDIENIIIDKEFWNKNHYNQGVFFNTGNMCLSKKAISMLISNYEIDLIKNPFVECKYMNYLFLKYGFKLKPLKGMTYQHGLGNDSFYMSHRENHMKFDSTFNWIL
jgi:hypothetical protein